jgi:hypothetical protein
LKCSAAETESSDTKKENEMGIANAKEKCREKGGGEALWIRVA